MRNAPPGKPDISHLPFSSVQVTQAFPLCAWTRRTVAPGTAMPDAVRTTPVARAEAGTASCDVAAHAAIPAQASRQHNPGAIFRANL